MNHEQDHTQPKASYKPLVIVLAICLLMAFAHQRFSLDHFESMMPSFMGYFFVLLSLFKFFDLKGFVQGFAMYDLVTQRVRGYGYAYPLIELCLGLAFLSGLYPIWTNIITIVVMTLSGVGVIKSLSSHKKFTCACLGTAMNVPLTTVSVIENLGMGIMAIYNLIFLI